MEPATEGEKSTQS